jgi:hypothetical protein
VEPVRVLLAVRVAHDEGTGGEVMVSDRDIEKLKALGYSVGPNPAKPYRKDHFTASYKGEEFSDEFDFQVFNSEADAWAACKARAQSHEGMVATMDAACAWLGGVIVRFSEGEWSAWRGETIVFGPRPSTAVSALLWKVP